ncbi:MAG: hypothetical protein K1Y02_04290 [Candidatus Hydrogenedentes bacterium]|nr:hypothetical protein [Candidatus Hydrogenedentota bacterium]
MNTATYLFDPTPYSKKETRRRHYPRSLSPGVRDALAQLRQTIDAIPKEEWAVRRRRWEELTKSLKPSR